MGVYVGDGGWEEYERFLELVEGTELNVLTGCDAYDESVYVGISVKKMKDDETVAQFKKRVNDQLPEEIEKKAHWITDGGRNG